MSSDTISVHGVKFEDFDDESVYEKASREAASENARNFVVEFSPEKVRIAFDLVAADFDVLLNTKTLPGVVRWINVWTPSNQPAVVKTIGDHYDFSPRLQALMNAPGQTLPRSQNHSHNSKAGEKATDIELGSLDDDDPASPTTTQALGDFDLYQLVKDTLNYTSVDQGESFICIGANWLHRRRNKENASDMSLVPPKHWSWLTLCSDYTVLSLHENPSFEYEDPNGHAGELKEIRYNTTSVLLQLSKHGFEKYKANILALKSVRSKPGRAMSPSRLDTTDIALEASSNLLYYLFEDYTAVVPILKASRKLLSDLSNRVLASSNRRSKTKTSDIIPRLYKLSKELRQLQHLFESYKLLIHRISRPRSLDHHGLARTSSGPLQLSGDIKLSQSARNRFERLGDRMQLLMLNTIREYLEEQRALSDTYFNLTAQKDSQATARLTRSATLLAKLSVFFLPIGFMTSYFSVQIPDLVEHYTVKTYWVSFAVIAGVSLLSLFFFSRMLMYISETLEDWAENARRWVRRKFGLTPDDDSDDES